MSSSPTISFALHDVTRLFHKRSEPRSRAPDIRQPPLQTLTLIQSKLLEARLKPAVVREKTHG